MRILVTGSEGLIGRSISACLERYGHEVHRLDIRRSPVEDIRLGIRSHLDEADGVVHLAAISRVVWGQKYPGLCHEINISALRSILANMKRDQWIVFGSSREVYGQQEEFPVRETATLQPVNTYARSKVKGEQAVKASDRLGNIVRFSSVYGWTGDHHDRVVPAFCRAAAAGGRISVEGSGNILDFTHINDVTDGLYEIIRQTMHGENLPPIHLVSGQGTSLGELAGLCRKHGSATIREAEPRSYDVSQFIGDPEQARKLLGWVHRTKLEDAIPEFIEAFRKSEDTGNRQAA